MFVIWREIKITQLPYCVHDLVRVKTNGRNVKAFYEFFPSYGDASSLDADGDGGV